MKHVLEATLLHTAALQDRAANAIADLLADEAPPESRRELTTLMEALTQNAMALREVAR